jgi:hypothetical protein
MTERLARLQRRLKPAAASQHIRIEGMIAICHGGAAIVALPDNGRNDVEVGS